MTTTATSSSSSTTTTSSSTGEFSRGKTIFVLAVVIGCFAILWPKIFYPMLTASLNVGDDSEQCCDVISEKDGNAYKLMNEICANILKRESSTTPGDTGGPPPALEEPKIEESGQGQQQKSSSSSGRKTYTPPKIRLTTAQLCRNEILKTCGLDVLILIQENPVITKQYKASLAKLRQYNTSQCLKENYGVDFQTVGLPRRFKNSDAHLPPSHMRPERPIHFHRPEMMHPAMRERGSAIPQTIPQRTLEKEARPGPFPGVRPPVGGAGYQAPAPKGGGTMGIIMPLYTIAIVVFFVYTIMKILFRKSEDKQPVVKDFGMDPEHRKYVFSEEYTPGSERSLKDQYNKEDREAGIRRRSSSGKRFQDQRSRLDSSEEDQQLGRSSEPAATSSSQGNDEIQLFEQLKPVLTTPYLAKEEKFPEELKLEKVLVREKSLELKEEEPLELFNELKPIETTAPLLREEKYPEMIVLEKIPVTEKKIEPPATEEGLELYNELRPVQTSALIAVEEKHAESIQLGQIPLTEKQLLPGLPEPVTNEEDQPEQELKLFNELKPVQTTVALAVEERYPEQIKLQKIVLKEQEINTDPGLELFNELRPVQTTPALAVEQKFPESIKLGKIVLTQTELNTGPGIELFNELKPMQTTPALAVQEKYPANIKLEEIILLEEKINTDPGTELFSDLKPVQTTPTLAVDEKFPERIKLGRVFAIEKKSSPPDFPRLRAKSVDSGGIQLFSDLKPIQTTPALSIHEKFPERIKLGRVFAIEKQRRGSEDRTKPTTVDRPTKNSKPEESQQLEPSQESSQEPTIIEESNLQENIPQSQEREEQLKVALETADQPDTNTEAKSAEILEDAVVNEQATVIAGSSLQESIPPAQEREEQLKLVLETDDQLDAITEAESAEILEETLENEQSLKKSPKKSIKFHEEDPIPHEFTPENAEPLITYKDVADLAGEIDEIIDLAETIASDIADQMVTSEPAPEETQQGASKLEDVETQQTTEQILSPEISSEKSQPEGLNQTELQQSDLKSLQSSRPLVGDEKSRETLALEPILVPEKSSRKLSTGDAKKVTFSEEPSIVALYSLPSPTDIDILVDVSNQGLKDAMLKVEDDHMQELECLNDSESESTVQPSPAPQSPDVNIGQQQQPDQPVSPTASEDTQEINSAQVVQKDASVPEGSAVEETILKSDAELSTAPAPSQEESGPKQPTPEPEKEASPALVPALKETTSQKEPTEVGTTSEEPPAPKPAIKKEVKILEVPKILEGLSAETTEEEYEEDEEEEEDEEDLPIRPPTPPRSIKRQSQDNSAAIANYAQQLANRIVKQGEETAATILEFEASKKDKREDNVARTASPIVTSVVNLEGTLEMENGHKLRSPTPPNLRSISMSPSPPAEIAPQEIEKVTEVPSIYLQGAIPPSANKVLISSLSDSQDELRHLKEDDDEEELEEEADQDSVSAPVVLSGKVTLSVIAGGPADDQPTEATSLSIDDYAKAISAHSEPNQQLITGQGSDLEEEEEEEEEVEEEEAVEEEEVEPVERANKGSDSHKQASASGDNAQKETKEEEATQYVTADKEDGPLNADGGDLQTDETAEDISALEGLEDGRLDDILPSDEEDELSGEEEEDEEEIEDEEEDEEEEEEEDEEEDPQKVPNKGPPV